MVVVDVVRDNEVTPWMSLPYAWWCKARQGSFIYVAHFKHWATQCALHD